MASTKQNGVAKAKSPSRMQVAARLARQRGTIDAHTHLGVDVANFYNGDFPYAMAAEDHGVRMRQSRVEAVVCFPFIYTQYFDLAAFRKGRFQRNLRSPDRAPYEFENRRLCQEVYEAFPEYGGRLLPFGCFDPGRKQMEQVVCLRQLADRYPLYGLKTATSYLHSFITDLLRAGRCLLDFAAERDIPVTIHSAVLPGDPWANVFEILKVVKARPDVRFAIAHTCRFDRRALDEAASLPNAFVDCSAFHIHCLLARQKHPAVAGGTNRFRGDYRRPAELLRQLAEAYPETLIWGSDTPAHYWKSRFRDDRGREHWLNLSCGPTDEVEALRRLSDPLQIRISHENSMRFLFNRRMP